MYFSAILLGSLLLSLRASAQSSCSHVIPIHSIISAPDGVLSINDEDGARQIKATVVNTPDCHMNSIAPTGQPLNENYTRIGQAGQLSDSCELKTIDGVKTFVSFQAIVVQTNGFPLNNVSLTLEDIDSSTAGWKEALSVFGVRDGALVVPTLELNNVTNLRISNYKVPADSVALLELSLGDIDVPGVEYVATTIENCPLSDVRKQKCLSKVHLSSPVDTIVVLYAVVTRGSTSSRSAAFISELQLSCGCRCRESNPGTRTITAAVQGIAGQCVRKETSGPRIECDVLGDEWCRKKDFMEYALTGNTLPNGNLECEEKAGQRMIIQSAFVPDPNFGGTN